MVYYGTTLSGIRKNLDKLKVSSSGGWWRVGLSLRWGGLARVYRFPTRAPVSTSYVARGKSLAGVKITAYRGFSGHQKPNSQYWHSLLLTCWMLLDTAHKKLY